MDRASSQRVLQHLQLHPDPTDTGKAGNMQVDAPLVTWISNYQLQLVKLPSRAAEHQICRRGRDLGDHALPAEIYRPRPQVCVEQTGRKVKKPAGPLLKG